MLSMQGEKVNRNEQSDSLTCPLVFFPGSLGDLLCLLPALEAIAKSENDKKIEIVARPELLALISRLSCVQRTFSLERRIFAQLFSSSTVKSEEISALFSPIAKIFSWFGHAHPEVKANLDHLAPGQARSFAFFSGQDDCHASAYYLRCVGIEELRSPSLYLEEEERKWIDWYWKQHSFRLSSRLLTIHPGSGGKKKRWDTEGFMQISRWWRREKGTVLILLGPAEEEEAKRWREAGEVERDVSLLQTAALLGRTAVYLGNDSGVSHLAGAVGARGVVLFGPTSPRQWRPLGGALSVLRNESFRERMDNVSGISLAEISVEEVQAALMRV